MKLQLKRSNVLVSGGAKEPTAAQLDYGELAINYSAGDAAIFLKDSTNNVIRIAGVHNIADDGLTNVPTTTSPPTSPTPEAGNLWYNSEDGRLYIYYVDDNSSQWVDASPDTWQTTVIPDTTNPAHQAGTLDDRYINTNGDTLTGALLLDGAATSTAPDLAFDGDTNTGIYSPGADKLSIATAGVQRVTVDGSGNVGIGTSGPSKSLEIFKDSFPCLMLNDGGQYKSYMQLGGNDLEIRGSSGSMEFYTGSDDGLSSTERMRLTNLGLGVGTGTITVGRPVHAHTSGGGSAYFQSTNDTTGQGSANGALFGVSGNVTYAPWSYANGPIVFAANGSESMRIDSSGRLLVGTTTEGAPAADNLTLQDSGSCGLTIRAGTSDYSTIYLSNATSGAGEYAGSLQYSHADNSLRIGTNSVERMRIDSTGLINVTGGIQVTENVTPSAGSGIEIFKPTSTSGQIQAFNRSGNAWMDLILKGNTQQFHANGSERMRIDGSGNVAIGATSSTSKLRVIGNEIRFSNSANASYYGTITHDAATTGANIYNNVDATTASHIWQHSGGEMMRLDNDYRLLLGTTAAGYTNAADNLTIADNGNCGMTIRSASGYVSSIYFADGTSGSAMYEGFIDYQHSVGDLRFGTGGGQERMRINSAGAMGLGVVPSALGGNSLEIHSAGSVNSFLALTNSTTGSNGSVHGFNIIMSDNEARLFNRENGDMTFWTNGTERVRIDSTGNLILKHTGKYILRENNLNAFSMYTDGANGSLIFKDEYNAVERMRHDQYGLNIGKTGYVDMVTDGHHLNKAGWGHHCSTNDNALYLNRNGTDGNIVAIYKAGSYRGNIYVNSSGTTFNSVSDYRLKENIIDITDGITRIKQLSPRRFNFITDADLTVDGFIAHEAQVVVPEAVCGAKDGEEMQGIDQSKLVPLLTAALQEAIAKIETLEQRLSVAGIA